MTYHDCIHELDNIIMRGVKDTSKAQETVRKIKHLLRPLPTIKSVCVALSDYVGQEVNYNDHLGFRVDGNKSIYGYMRRMAKERPDLIVMIGRIYEAYYA